MKTATIPSLRVHPDLRKAAQKVLTDGETLSAFVEQSIRESVERRQAQGEFIARGLAARKTAKQTNTYISADTVIGKLEKSLARAKAKARK